MADSQITYERFSSSFHRGVGHDALLDLFAEAEDRPALAAELADGPDSEVRAWVAHALPELVSRRSLSPGAAAGVLERMATKEHDPDTRDEAVGSLLSVDRGRALRLVPVLRRRLQSRDYYAPVVAMWALAELGAEGAIDDVRAYAARMGEDRWQGQQARIVADLLERDDEALATRLESHDHDMTHALCRAALLMPTHRLRKALQRCAGAFEEECSHRCREALERLATQSGQERLRGPTHLTG